MIVLGTSLKVAPVNGLPQAAKALSQPRILINREVVADFDTPQERDAVLLGEIDAVVLQLCQGLGVDIAQFREQNLKMQQNQLDVSYLNQERLELCLFKNSLIVPDAYTQLIAKEVCMFGLSTISQV